ncbi:cytochrome-c peroxidase [Pasteurella multocida]|uniref:cytochrome-c peroxidase n=1 Tax=Pasteurella multocida TaxID=747 RepID=UPI0002569CBE|nr:cytochrome-c peroxidase [Pasteurella multocida]AFF23550.1 cytochrome c peroxidase [Pasteurella multocida subsp. multocida str. HN06]MCL7774958.1 cytochrome-c peroxidase [Pasteurella multocida]MCL8063940.1 cytochrome-c peroxidase [Pasteurella multocida]MCL8066288.1 cytochrome-c peroxidase [Pasteurella multocida]MCW4599939.1 cytochrome-c peroxidase [Pasteurella multocida subsp. multocida]
MRVKNLFFSVVAIAVASFLGTVGYVHIFDKEQSAKLLSQTPLSGQAQQVAKILYDNGCQYCHSTNAELPFYAKFPVAESIMQEDIKKGTRVFLLNEILDGLKDPTKLSEVSLAKLEQVLINDEMPVAKFVHLHWGSRPDLEEKTTLLNWIREQRQNHFLPANTQGTDPTRLVQPIPDSVATDPLKVALGDMLYHDGRLSGDGTIQCHTCHQLKNGGVDGLDVSVGIDGLKGGINAPTVYNSVFNILQFWDGRAKDLAEQAGGPPLNPVEMGSKNWEEIIAKFEQDEAFKAKFLAVYPAINEATITHAIAEFEKTLITPNSAFDRYLKGEQNALTAAQIRGYELFKQHKCDTCHVGVAMGGQSFEYMGLFDDYFAARGTPITEADQGRFAHTQDPADMHKFKVPTLRNIALTAPYMHDARTSDLKEAVRIMLHYQSGKTLPTKDVEDISVFLESLTGEYQGKLLTKENQ